MLSSCIFVTWRLVLQMPVSRDKATVPSHSSCSPSLALGLHPLSDSCRPAPSQSRQNDPGKTTIKKAIKLTQAFWLS